MGSRSCSPRSFLVLAALVAASLAFATSPAAATPSRPDGTVELGPATFTDGAGRTFEVALRAREFAGDTGRGRVVFTLNTVSGHRISLCSTHGPAAVLDFDTETGNNPLQGIQCGSSGNQRVAVDRCSVHVEGHGFAHVDAPEIPVLGPVQYEVRFQADTDGQGGSLEVRIFSERAQLIVRGHVEAPVTMETCE